MRRLVKKADHNRVSRSETSEETHSPEAEIEPHPENTALDSVCLSHGSPCNSSGDARETSSLGNRETEHRPDGGQSLEHRGHGTNSTNDPDRLHAQDLDGMGYVNGGAADVQSLAQEHDSHLSAQNDENLCRESIATIQRSQRSSQRPVRKCRQAVTSMGAGTRQLRPRVSKRGLDGEGVDSNDEYRPASKRRKTASFTHDSTPRAQQRQKRGRRRSARQPIVQALSTPRPPASQAARNEAYTTLAKPEEWPLENVLLKRVIDNGVATFQLQFTWDSCPKYGGAGEDQSTENQRPSSRSKKGASAKQRRARKDTFAPDEDKYLSELKEKLRLPWKEIHERFTESFPGRSRGALQVRYCTKLKRRDSSNTSSQRERLSKARG
ncbi:hypothetical protein F5Y16DRAFT_406984 [Xylariaceae sp. FL0255]|nr:hypothetical protein F5Y16DRAFT_406984 [Xylariaceae sp. FL0255]